MNDVLIANGANQFFYRHDGEGGLGGRAETKLLS